MPARAIKSASPFPFVVWFPVGTRGPRKITHHTHFLALCLYPFSVALPSLPGSCIIPYVSLVRCSLTTFLSSQTSTSSSTAHPWFHVPIPPQCISCLSYRFPAGVQDHKFCFEGKIMHGVFEFGLQPTGLGPRIELYLDKIAEKRGRVFNSTVQMCTLHFRCLSIPLNL